MSWLKEVIGTEKAVVAMCHLMPMPGDPHFKNGVDSMDQVIEWARKDLIALQEGGVDAVMFSNEFSLPYLTDVEPVTVACMARIIGELKDDIKIPYGVNVLWDAKKSLDLAVATDAKFVREIFTGTKFQGRKELEKILKRIRAGDTLVFDSVSRMSRTAEEGFQMYKQLFQKDIQLVFLKEPYINTDIYKEAIERQINISMKSGDKATDDLMAAITAALNEYMLALAAKQIYLAFQQAEKEVQDLHQRTREGMETARLNGKQIGQKLGSKLVTKKSVEAKKLMEKYSKSFNGTLNNEECIRLIGISRGTFYKYKRELQQSL